MLGVRPISFAELQAALGIAGLPAGESKKKGSDADALEGQERLFAIYQSLIDFLLTVGQFPFSILTARYILALLIEMCCVC